ncbi:unnamed protein product [Durusdinium trenchii]|uniref:Uncharacterized protein n=2 Tax=Durusdinium trenchii TaxID=1381693 RepID=A0ABP0RF90_9DINO
MTGEECAALSYCSDVLRGLACRELPKPPELQHGGASLQRWQLWQEESHKLWQDYLSLRRRHLGFAPLAGFPERSAQVLVLIEMRAHQDLDIVLRQSLSTLHGQWAILLVCGEKNRSFVEEVVRNWSFVHLMCLPREDLSRQAYANFRRSQELLAQLKAIGAEVVLFLECDAVLLRPGVERFLHFDLVGAPWAWAKSQDAAVGNGGLCVRRLDFMCEALRCMGASHLGEVEDSWWPRNEDIGFAQAALQMGSQVPRWKLAAEFSVESMFHPRPVGCHKPWQYLLPSDMLQLLELWEVVD